MNLIQRLRRITRKAEQVFFLRNLYKRTFETEDGRLVLQDLFRHFAFSDRTTLRPGAPDATAYQEGQRSVWTHIQRRLEMSDAEMRALQRESAAQEDAA